MPSLYDILQLYVLDQFFLKNPDPDNQRASASRDWNIPIIVKTKTFYSPYTNQEGHLAILPTIPISDAQELCRAYNVYHQPTAFAPAHYNAREFTTDGVCKFTDFTAVEIAVDMKDLLLFSNEVSFMIYSNIEPWMHKERERLFEQKYRRVRE